MSYIKKISVSVVISAFILCLASFSMAKSGDDKKEDKLSTAARLAAYKARTALSEEKLDDALTILNEYLSEESENAPLSIYELLAHIWLQKKDTLKARKYYKIMYGMAPDDPRVLKNYASLCYQTEQFRESALLFERLYEIEENAKPGGSLPLAANAYMLVEDLDNAKRVLEKLVALPGTPEAQWYDVLINICIEREEDAEAEKYILDFLKIDPVQARYWRYLSHIRMKRDEWKTATSDLEISHRVEVPKNRKDWITLGDLYVRAVNAPLMGARCYEEAYKEENDEKGYLDISRIYQRGYRYDEAVKVLDEGILKNPESSALFFEKGRVLYEARQYKDAVKALEECVKIDPKYGDAYFQMGLAAWTMKEWDTARTAFVQAERLSEKYKVQSRSVISLLDDLNKEKAEIVGQ
jgi:tetratricopeptide (TPR) repeat protein